jgi:hypothetical protein
MIIISPLFSQDTIPFSSDRWNIEGQEFEITEYNGQESLMLREGIAYLREVDFLNGTIEFDMSIPDQRGFMGVVWRLQDRQNYEEFYVRPHQSGNPDAIQYTPVFNGLASWQLYHGEGFSSTVDYVFDEWMHIKIVLNGQSGEIYIMDMDNPALVIHEMKRDLESGRIGVEAGNFAAGRFANFSYTEEDNPDLKSRIKQFPDPVYGTVISWEVSNPLPEEGIKDKIILEESFINGLIWTEMQSESSGIINLARLSDLTKGNTVLVRLSINADEDQMKGFQVGYSDRVQVYLNNLILYSGQNEYRSRDYRYLGTIGYFDEIYLPLQRGMNILVISVSEDFGGWGIMGKFRNTERIAY